MIHILQSLQDLLLRYAGTPAGMSAMAAIPRDPILTNAANAMKQIGISVTDRVPNSNATSRAIFALLTN